MIQATTRLASHDLKKLVPGLYPAVNAIDRSGDVAGLDKGLIELVKLRVSQINGCAYCVQYHISNCRQLGVPDEKINLVVTWEESGIFSEREEAAFAWAEALTLIAETHVPDEAYNAARSVFPEAELASLTSTICAINVKNRIAVTYRYAPEI